MSVHLRSSDNLQPVRAQLTELVASGSKVIEFACGNGELLFQLSPKITYGLGIDVSANAVTKAELQKQRLNIFNIDFLCKELNSNFKLADTYDVGIASLFFHVIPQKDALYLLTKIQEICNTLIIAAFCPPQTFSQKTLLWLDQKMTSHFKNFKAYRQQGYMQGLLAKANCNNAAVIDTSIPFLKIYKIN